jgi:hypothetical protein
MDVVPQDVITARWLLSTLVSVAIASRMQRTDAPSTLLRPGLEPLPVGPVLCPPFNIQRHIELAVELQRMAEPERVAALRELGRQGTGRLIVLARMLFEARPGEHCRAPHIGIPMYLGTSTAEDWSLDPITIVDGVPFIVVTGYFGTGMPESAEQYLDYNLRNCRWTDHEYRVKTIPELQTALGKLIKGGPWKRPLLASTITSLEGQLLPSPATRLDCFTQP